MPSSRENLKMLLHAFIFWTAWRRNSSLYRSPFFRSTLQLLSRKVCTTKLSHSRGSLQEISETEPLAETKVCITPCFREGLLFQCYSLSAKERHYRRWQGSLRPRLGSFFKLFGRRIP